MNYLSFTPIYQERVWGGRALQTALERTLPAEKPIGESWEVVDRPEAQSVVREGIFKGKTLRDVLTQHAARVMGPKWPSDKPFPILIKWLDARDRLSLQVHPPKDVAEKLGGEPKTEIWYLADATPQAGLLAGLKEGVTREAFERALHDNTAEACVQRFPAQRGDCLFVPSGRLHAIDAGCLILEVQQNSDTTYRVYDWGRVGLDGKPRALHVEASLASIAWGDTHPDFQRPDGSPRQLLADAPEFRMVCHRLKAGEALAFKANEEPRLLSVVDGALEETLAGGELRKGDNALLPYADAFVFRAQTDAVVLVTDRFDGAFFFPNP